MTDVAADLSRTLTSAVEHAAGGVVAVAGRRRGPSSGVVWADGLIVTAHHTLEWDEGIEVHGPDGAPLPAALVGRDPSTDLALLRVGTSGLHPVRWSEAVPKVGQLALGVSRARGLRATLGVVSAVGGPWRTAAGGLVDQHLETDVRPHAGFSGSLLVDTSGAGLGLNTAGLVRGGGVALPPSTVKRVVEALAAHGQVRRGYLGVSTLPVRFDPEAEAAAAQAGGLLITSVQSGSPAQQGGVLLGDVLLAIDGSPLSTARDLLARLDEERVGRAAALRVLRAGQASDLQVTVGSRERSAS